MKLIPAVLIGVVLMQAPRACDGSETRVDLSPDRWPKEDYDRQNSLMQVYGADKPAAEGTQEVISGTTSPLAIRAGFEALRQGGTAADAVITASLAQVTLAAGSWVSFAGIYSLVYYEASTGQVSSLNANFNTVLAEDDPASIPTGKDNRGNPSGRAVLVPGYMAGIEATHRRFGKLPWHELFRPAIHFAQHGFAFTPLHEAQLKAKTVLLSRRPDTLQLFTKPDATPYRQGDVFRQPQIAQLVRNVSQHGAAYMYTGPWAKRMVETVRHAGGRITTEDMSRYKVIWSPPVKTEYGDFEIFAPGLPSHGGVDAVEALNVAQAAALKQMGDYRSSPESFFWLNQIADAAVISHLSTGDASLVFGGKPPTAEQRMTKEHAARLWERMKSGKFPITASPIKPSDKHSDAVVAIDGSGNVAALVHTINADSWGTGIFVDGVSLPDTARQQQQAVERAGRGNRLADPMQPVIVMKHGKPVFALASIGAGLHQKTFTTLVNLLDRGETLKQAIDSAAPHLPDYGAPPGKTVQVSEGDFEPRLLAAVKELGLKVRVFTRDARPPAPRGYVVGAAIDPATGKRQAVGDRTFNAVPLGR